MYTVLKPFTYNGKPLQRGDVWEPQGARTDSAILAARLVGDATARRAASHVGATEAHAAVEAARPQRGRRA